MIDSDRESESENETLGTGESAFASTEEWIQGNISWELEDFTRMTGVTAECNNLRSVSEKTINFWLAKIKIAKGLSFWKNLLINKELN